jgi:Glu-tRNA(Gln) amidotransferase subunit E-like FAD-binding protein
MSIRPRARALPHLFMPGDTIQAVIKKTNLHDVQDHELKDLVQTYGMINGNEVPKAGTSVMIPILGRHQATVFGKKT